MWITYCTPHGSSNKFVPSKAQNSRLQTQSCHKSIMCCTMKLSFQKICLLMLAMRLNSGLVCATQTRLRTRYATGHDAAAIPPRLLKEQKQSEGVQVTTKVDEEPTKLSHDATPETPNVNGQERIPNDTTREIPNVKGQEPIPNDITPKDTTPETPDVNDQEERPAAVGMLAALPEVRLDEVFVELPLGEDEQASFDENTAIALERHETPPEERDVAGDNIFPFGEGQIRNLSSGRNAEGSLETIEKVSDHQEHKN